MNMSVGPGGTESAQPLEGTAERPETPNASCPVCTATGQKDMRCFNARRWTASAGAATYAKDERRLLGGGNGG